MVTVDMISYNIKFFREQHGWTQEQLANKMLSSRSKIAKWESNTNIPDIESLIELCDLFDVSLDHLVGRQSFQKELLTDFKRIYQLNGLNSHRINHIIRCEFRPFSWYMRLKSENNSF